MFNKSSYEFGFQESDRNHWLRNRETYNSQESTAKFQESQHHNGEFETSNIQKSKQTGNTREFSQEVVLAKMMGLKYLTKFSK